MYLGNDDCIELKSVTRISDDHRYLNSNESINDPSTSKCKNIFDFNQNSETGIDKSVSQGNCVKRNETLEFRLSNSKNCKKQSELFGEALKRTGDRSINHASVSINQQYNLSHVASGPFCDRSRIKFSTTGRKVAVYGLNQRAATNLMPIENQNLKRNTIIGRQLKPFRHMQIEETFKDEISHNQKKVIQDLNSLFSSSTKLLNYKNRLKINFPETYIERFSFNENYPTAPGYFKKCSHVYSSRISDSSFSDEETY